MTAQVKDTCFHREISFEIVAVAGVGLLGVIELESLGVRPIPDCTACWRGYVAYYHILDGQLVLTRLHVDLSPDDAILARAGRGTELFGVSPAEDELVPGFLYQGFELPVAFTGGLLLGDEFIWKSQDHRGHPLPWQYQNMRTVIFENGQVVADVDRSTEAAAVRTRLLEKLQGSREPFGKYFSRQLKTWPKKYLIRKS